jgi:LacI family transcriptional regulator
MKKQSQSNGSLADVAARSGVSKATVSRVLNNVGSASEETRRRILQAAQELQYAPDPRFRMLGRQSGGNGVLATGNLGFLLQGSSDAERFASNPYYGRLFWGLQREAQAQQYHLLVSTVDNHGADYLPQVVANGLVDGIVAHAGLEPDLVSRVNAIMPIVLVNDRIEGLGVPALMSDERSGMRQALAHLKAFGHNRIVFFHIDDAPPRIVHHRDRADAFRQLALEGPDRIDGARLVVHPPRTKSMDDTALDQLAAWRAAGQMPTALICPSDGHAVAFLHAAAHLGLSVPHDLSLIGTDDTVVCEHVRPRLTSIRQPLEAMGAAAVRALLDRLRHPESEPVGVTQSFEVKLIERESCGPCVRGAAGIRPAGRKARATAKGAQKSER